MSGHLPHDGRDKPPEPPRSLPLPAEAGRGSGSQPGQCAAFRLGGCGISMASGALGGRPEAGAPQDAVLKVISWKFRLMRKFRAAIVDRNFRAGPNFRVSEYEGRRPGGEGNQPSEPCGLCDQRDNRNICGTGPGVGSAAVTRAGQRGGDASRAARR
jgi:hypothetical protein